MDEAGFVPRVDQPAELDAYLRRRGWLADSDRVVSVAPAGDGNMNRTLRVVSAQRRLVVKHGPPWVERYPEIPAPVDRTLVEAAFYELLPPPVAARMPAFHGVDRHSRVLVLEDVAGALDLTPVYEGVPLDEVAVEDLLAFLHLLHRVEVPVLDRPLLANTEMRALNHEYIFRLPLAVNASLLERLDGITPGLAKEARRLADDTHYQARAEALGGEYLHGAPRALVHGDFFPGSWLSDGSRVWTIDPEFCFLGAPEFDYGVMAAHLILAGQGPEIVRAVAMASRDAGCDPTLAAGFAGIEVMRRLLGVAQLPRLQRTLSQKRSLLDVSRGLVLEETLLDRG